MKIRGLHFGTEVNEWFLLGMTVHGIRCWYNTESRQSYFYGWDDANDEQRDYYIQMLEEVDLSDDELEDGYYEPRRVTIAPAGRMPAWALAQILQWDMINLSTGEPATPDMIRSDIM